MSRICRLKDGGEVCSRAAEVALVGDGDEESEVAKFHEFNNGFYPSPP